LVLVLIQTVAAMHPSPRLKTAVGGRRFLVIDGRRVWLDTPPEDVLADLNISLRCAEINHPIAPAQ
jgi:hypothetical protein